MNETEAISRSRAAPDWLSLPESCWNIILDTLEREDGETVGGREGKRGLTRLFCVFTSNRRVQTDLGLRQTVINLLGSRKLAMINQASMLVRLCESVAAEKLELGAYFPAELLLYRPRFQELHATKLIELQCALTDFSILQHFPRLRILEVCPLYRTPADAHGGLLGSYNKEQLNYISTLQNLEQLTFLGCVHVPLEGITLAPLEFLVVAAGDLKEGHEQDVFHLSLPSSRVKYLYVQGPMTPVECNVELIRKYDTSFDLFDAAAKCENIMLNCSNLVLLDPTGEFTDPPYTTLIVEALRRGSVWGSITIELEPTLSVSLETQEQEAPGICILTESDLIPVEFEEVMDALGTLGPEFGAWLYKGPNDELEMEEGSIRLEIGRADGVLTPEISSIIQCGLRTLIL